jgi:hypothetical protein
MIESSARHGSSEHSSRPPKSWDQVAVFLALSDGWIEGTTGVTAVTELSRRGSGTRRELR